MPTQPNHAGRPFEDTTDPRPSSQPAASQSQHMQGSIAGFLQLFGPYAFLVALAGCLFSVFTLSRAWFVGYYFDRVAVVDGFGWLFVYGARIDVIVVCTLLGPPALFLSLEWNQSKWLRAFLRVYFCLAVIIALSMELLSISFINEYDARPNRLFIENLIPGTELSATIWSDYKYILLGIGCVLLLTSWGTWRLSGVVVRTERHWPRWARLAALSIIGPLLFVGIRGTDHRPVNISSAFFSTDHLANQLALNSTYSAAYAAYRQRNESSPIKMYGQMPEAEILQRVRKYLAVEGSSFESAEVPFLRVQQPRVPREHPRNVVVVLEESFGAMFVHCLGGPPVTPEFDKLSREGLLFRRMFSTGTRTVRGMEATISGFLPTPGRSVVKLERSQRDFFTVAAMLKEHGYATDFIYGGESHFDNMRAFLLGNGFENVMDQTSFKHPSFRGTWGVCDEDLMKEANACFAAHGDQPFFALILSTSNHTPFEFPQGRIALHDQPQATRLNSVKYADFAIGELFRMARKEDYFANTIWVIVADHNLRTYGDDLIPVDKFRIPALILGPGIKPGAYDAVASQVDLLPTVLPFVGVILEHPMLGRDVLSLPANAPGRAILQQFDTHAFLLGDQVVVHQPHKPGLQFVFHGGRLDPAELDPELERDALAHALVPWTLYSQSRHRLNN